MASSKKRKCYLEGYRSSIQDEGSYSKKRYLDKLKLIGGLDPYETDKKEWKDDVDLWPCITHVHIGMYLLITPTHVHIGMYLLITPSPNTGEQLLSYKSLDCYQNFLAGWVREVMVRAVFDCDGVEKRLLIAKVCQCTLHLPLIF